MSGISHLINTSLTRDVENFVRREYSANTGKAVPVLPRQKGVSDIPVLSKALDHVGSQEPKVLAKKLFGPNIEIPFQSEGKYTYDVLGVGEKKITLKTDNPNQRRVAAFGVALQLPTAMSQPDIAFDHGAFPMLEIKNGQTLAHKRQEIDASFPYPKEASPFPPTQVQDARDVLGGLLLAAQNSNSVLSTLNSVGRGNTPVVFTLTGTVYQKHGLGHFEIKPDPKTPDQDIPTPTSPVYVNQMAGLTGDKTELTAYLPFGGILGAGAGEIGRSNVFDRLTRTYENVGSTGMYGRPPTGRDVHNTIEVLKQVLGGQPVDLKAASEAAVKAWPYKTN